MMAIESLFDFSCSAPLSWRAGVVGPIDDRQGKRTAVGAGKGEPPSYV